MSNSDDRRRIAQAIVDLEARRDRQGHLQIYKLPNDDGGGGYEVAGINEHYHPDDARHLAELIESGEYAEAEDLACEIVASLTDHVEKWTGVVALESYLRDCSFNRGPSGAARILQDALGVEIDGRVGDRTSRGIRERERDPRQLLLDLRAARERYERRVAGRDETSRFWRGLVSRWNKALELAMNFLPDGAFHAAAAATRMLDGNAGTGPGMPGAAAAVGLAADIPAAADAVDAGAELDQVDGPGVAIAALAVPVPGPPQVPIAVRALRQGVQGPLVRAWQSFLVGQKLDPGGLDGDFGDKTVTATMAFQRREGLAADGVAGRQTLMSAMALGFELIEEPASDNTGSNYPPRPDFPPLTGTAARRAVFGAFQFVAAPAHGDRERIRIIGDWEQKNIVMVPIPQLRAALGPKAPSGMRFHRLAAEQLKGLWQDWEIAGFLDRIVTFDGSFVPRFIRGSTTSLSNHAFGSAFDINASQNRLGARPALVGEHGSTRELVPLANKWGFYWGGHFGTRPDGMHFEVAFLSAASA